MTTVQKLPQDVQNLLRSGVVISDVTRCVSELVENALDARCTSVAVRLNFNTFNLQVIDNGCGLTKEQLDLIGTRYMTSKCSSLQDLKKGLSSYGYRGEALASIKESCAVLTIVSKANGSRETYCKVFRNNVEPKKAEVAAHDRVCIGTTVIVKDFLCGQPVRRARIRPIIELEQIRFYLVAQAIVNHKVAFTLRNDVSKTMILQSVPCEDLITAFSRLCKTEASKELINIVASNNCFNISGCISRQTESSNQFQFLYINQHFLRKTKIHKVINVFLQNSFYLRDIAKQKVKKVYKNQSGGSVDSSPVTSCKFAVFVINIKCPPNEYEIFFEPKRTLVELKKWESLLECIKRAVDSFLETEIDLKVKKSAEKYPLKLIDESMNENNNNNSYNIKENSSIIIGLKVKRAEENKNAASIVNSPILTDINKTNNTSQNTLDNLDTIKDCTTLIPQNLSPESYPLKLIEKNMNENHSNSNNIEENSNFIFDLKVNMGEQNKITAPILNSPIVTDINIANNTNENTLDLLDTITDCTTLKPQKLSTNSSEKYESENPLTKSCRSQTLLCKKRGLSEHVTTESEMDPTPVKKLSIFNSSSLVIVNKNVSLQIKRTTLPIVSQDLFESNRNEIMSNWKTLLKVNSNPKMESTENTSQVRIFRNIKTVQTKRYPKKINQDKIFRKEIHFRTNQKSICNEFITDKMNKSYQPINVKRSLYEMNFKKKTLKTCKEINNNIVKNLSHNLIVNKPSKNQNMSCKQKFSFVKPNPIWNFHKKNNFNNVNFKIPCAPNQIFDHNKSLKKEFHSKVNLQPGSSDISTVKYSLKKSCISNFNNECVISEPCYDNGFKSLNSGYYKSNTQLVYNDAFFAPKRKCNEQSFPVRECQPRCRNLKNDIISKDEYIIEKLNSDDALHFHEMGSKKDIFLIEKGNLNLNRDIIKKDYPVIQNDIKTNSDIVYLYESGSKTNQSSIGKGRLNTINYNTEVNIPSDRLSLKVIDNDNVISNLTKSNNIDREILNVNERNIHDINMKEDNLKNPENSMLSENNDSMFNINTMSELNNHHILFTENLNMCNNSEQTRKCTSIKERTHNKEIVVDLENGMVIVDSVVKGLINDELGYNEFKLQNTPKRNTNIEYKHDSENASAFVLLNQETTKHNEISLDSDINNETINDKHLTTVIDSNDEQINLQSNISKLNNKIVVDTTKEYLQHNFESSECTNFITANKNEVQCENLCSEDPNQNSLILQSVDNISKNNSSFYWNKRTISNGKNIYIHSKTGMSSYLSPVHEFEDYAMSNRPWFVPKGCSPIMQALDNSCQGIEQLTSSAKKALLSVAKIDDTGDNLASVKWRNGDVDIEGNSDIISKLLSEGNVSDENWKHNHYGEVLRKPYVFNRGSLASAVVLGQVDSKFLTAILNDGSPSSLLVLFDQHAVDERIRLEKLSSGYKNIKGGLNSTCINPSLQITVTDSELLLVRNFLFHIQKLGLEISIEGPDLIITSVPTCLYNHALKEGNDKMRTILKDKVELLVKEQIQCLTKTRGVALSIPDTLYSIICYEACRGAIKFGDKLPKAMPQCLISELAKCELPFQCAHGRPVLTVLTELMPMDTEKWKPNLTNLKVRSHHRLKHLNLRNVKQNGFDTML